MRIPKHLTIISLLGAMLATAACNKEDASSQATAESLESEASTLVSGFSLKPNIKILRGLDSVYFSINQPQALIYNADSLPWGTDVRRMLVNVSVPAAGGVEIVMPSRHDGRDTVIDLLSTPNDSINFSHGSVQLRVSPVDGGLQRIYTVKLNVHAIKADSLQWSARRYTLPAGGNMTAEAAVKAGKKYVSLARLTDGSMELLLTENPIEQNSWTRAAARGLPADAVTESLTATDDGHLYLLGADGTVYRSTDTGDSWSAATSGWSHIYGSYGSDIVGVRGSEWATWPGDKHGALPQDIPVSGTSQMFTYSNEWAIYPQAMFVGGKNASGEHAGESWGFDGNGWMRLNADLSADRTLPAAEGYTLFPYFTFRVNNTNFMAGRQSAWIAFGGKDSKGEIDKTVYISLDNGVNWRKADENLQLPEEMGARTGARALTLDRRFTADSRAIKPITEWNAPYILIFGGQNAAGTVEDEIWKGVINRLTFKPLQ